MARELSDLRAEVLAGIRASMQGSYARRAPAHSSMPYLVHAREELLGFLRDSPNSVEGWELLSQVEECLLNYPRAIQCLQKATDLSSRRDRRSLKRLVRMEEAIAEWSEISLSPDQLRALGEYLVQCGAGEELYGRTLEFTTTWLEENDLNVEETLQSLRKRGAFTDFLILHNVVRL